MNNTTRFIHLDMNIEDDRYRLKALVMKAYEEQVGLRAIVDVVHKKGKHRSSVKGEAAERSRLAAKLP